MDNSAASTALMVKKVSVGRPRKPTDEHQILVPVRFPPDLIERMDAEIEARGDGQSRSGFIREQVALGLASAERRRRGQQ